MKTLMIAMALGFTMYSGLASAAQVIDCSKINGKQQIKESEYQDYLNCIGESRVDRVVPTREVPAYQKFASALGTFMRLSVPGMAGERIAREIKNRKATPQPRAAVIKPAALAPRATVAQSSGGGSGTAAR